MIPAYRGPFSNLKNPLRTIRIMNALMLTSIFIFGIVIYLVLPGTDLRIFAANGPLLLTAAIILGIMSMLAIASAYYFPKVFGKKIEKTEAWYINMHIIRIGFLETVGIYGLILGVLGIEWPASLSFLVISFIAMLLAFPTKERWERFTQNRLPGRNMQA